MKNKLVIFFLLLLVNYNIFSETENILNENNEYGGITKEIAFDESENDQLVKFLIYYDDRNMVIKHVYYISQSLIETSGIKMQTVFYDINQKITQIVMEYSDDYFKVHGITKLIEHVKKDQVVLSEWFKDDVIVDYLYDLETSNRYPFYKLSFLESVVVHNDVPDDADEFINLSAQYVRSRSVVLCNGTVEPLNDTDKKILGYLAKHISWPDLLTFYNSKMLIEEDGKKYMMFIQNGLEEKIPREKETTIRYYIIGYNGQLYITLVNVLANVTTDQNSI